MMSWNKKDRMVSLDQKVCEGEVDEAILPIVEAINSHPEYFTTSSCAGRIVLLQIPGLGDKEEAAFLAKWHRNVEIEDVKGALSNLGDEGLTFLLAQSPIIHVRCKNMKSAVELRNLAVESGLKYSTLKSLTLNSREEPVKIVVEILSSENIHVPIHDSWHKTFRISYWLDSKYFGQTQAVLSDDELTEELEKHDIDYYFIWGKSQSVPEILSQYKEISG